MAEPLRISKDAARRFVLGKQGLWPGRRFAGTAGTRDAGSRASTSSSTRW